MNEFKKNEIVLLGGLQSFPDGKKNIMVCCGESLSVEEVIRSANVLPDMEYVVLVNGKNVKRGYITKDGDRISLLSPVTGG